MTLSKVYIYACVCVYTYIYIYIYIYALQSLLIDYIRSGTQRAWDTLATGRFGGGGSECHVTDKITTIINRQQYTYILQRIYKHFPSNVYLCVCVCVCMYVYIYIYICIVLRMKPVDLNVVYILY